EPIVPDIYARTVEISNEVVIVGNVVAQLRKCFVSTLRAVFIDKVAAADRVDEHWRLRGEKVVKKALTIIISLLVRLNLIRAIAIAGGLNEPSLNPKHRHPAPHSKPLPWVCMSQD